MNTEIHELAAAIADLKLPTIPFNERFWSIKTIAEYCDCSQVHVRKVLVKERRFPRPARFPSQKGCGQPRYRGKEVIAYVNSLVE